VASLAVGLEWGSKGLLAGIWDLQNLGYLPPSGIAHLLSSLPPRADYLRAVWKVVIPVERTAWLNSALYLTRTLKFAGHT